MAASPQPEAKLGVIPRVVKYGFGSIREYSVLLTDRRLIFVITSLNRMFLVAAAVGGAVGAAVAAPAARDSSDRGMAYAFNDDPATLASLPNGLVIPYEGIRRLMLKKYPADYEMVIDYVNDAGKKDGIRLQLKPTDQLEAQSRAAGVSGKAMMHDYAAGIQAALLRALPPAVAARAEWKF